MHVCFPQLQAAGVSHHRTALGTHTQPGGRFGGGGVTVVPASAPAVPAVHVFTSPVHAPHTENSPCFVQVCVPSWQPPPLRWSLGTVQHARVCAAQPHPVRSPPFGSQLRAAASPPPPPRIPPLLPELPPLPLPASAVGSLKPESAPDPPQAAKIAMVTDPMATHVAFESFMHEHRSNAHAVLKSPDSRAAARHRCLSPGDPEAPAIHA
jgi:hypothetical protein